MGRSLRFFFAMSVLSIRLMPCDGAKIVREADLPEIKAYFRGQNKTVLTFLGYSGAEYENKPLMLQQAMDVLEKFPPEKTIVNIGATEDGMGAVYEIAKRNGFATTGIVSTQAKESGTALSPCVDIVFFIKDSTWGGFLPGSKRLSPTSQAMVEVSDHLVAIGGGEVSRDELIAAKKLGKKVRYIPADMNHEIALEKARKKGQPAPTDFKGAAADALK